MKLHIELTAEQLGELYRLVGTPAVGLDPKRATTIEEKHAQICSVIEYALGAIVAGVRRPGAWERGIVVQLFGDVPPRDGGGS